ncbi:hypothetical protein QTP70_011129 [Hemibagrus guttatus]|uniref:Uncharacterized protein n=1 Tax=Hemibagrus guttatus TaxID=175788 RepID=A0AAE0QXX8_9TELE|nr:hypothetical protein QTP70_011129 [Hemibagrus guttatus]
MSTKRSGHSKASGKKLVPLHGKATSADVEAAKKYPETFGTIIEERGQLFIIVFTQVTYLNWFSKYLNYCAEKMSIGYATTHEVSIHPLSIPAYPSYSCSYSCSCSYSYSYSCNISVVVIQCRKFVIYRFFCSVKYVVVLYIVVV